MKQVVRAPMEMALAHPPPNESSTAMPETERGEWEYPPEWKALVGLPEAGCCARPQDSRMQAHRPIPDNHSPVAGGY